VEELVEGGSFEEPLPHDFDSRRHREETASKITFWLLGITAVSFVAHAAIVTVSYFLGRADVAEGTSEVFRVWIPLFSGFLGSALGYYFAQRDR
jgi:hypothetical protein